MKDNTKRPHFRKAEKGRADSDKTEKSPKKLFDKTKSYDKKKPYDKTKSYDRKSQGNANRKGGNNKDLSGQKGVKRTFTSSTGAVAQKMDLIASLKTDWNKVRVKTMKTDERNLLMKKMADRVRGRILQISLRHDVSRIIQSILQFGSNELRSQMLAEISAKVLELSKTPYGHFTILKAISYCTATEDQKIVTKALLGHFVSLGTNVIGARIVESVLHLYPAKLTKDLKAEFYGKNFRILLNEAPKNIQNIVDNIPSKVGPLMDHMRDLVQKLIDKSLLEFSYVHQLLYEYIWELHNQQLLPKIEDLVNQLSEQLPKLLTTKPGAKASCILITYASAKDRKRMMKSLKSKVLESLLHPSAHLGVIRLIQSTDDVVNVQKMILSEIKAVQPEIKYSASGDMISDLLPPLVRIACSAFGSKWLLHLLAAPTDRILEPDEQPFFDLTSPTSKKTDVSRRREHLLYLKSTLVTVFSKHSGDIIRNRYATRVMYELVRVYYPARLIDSVARISAGLLIVDTSHEDVVIDEDDDEDDEEEGYDEEDEEAETAEQGQDENEDEDIQVDGDQAADDDDWGEIDEVAAELLEQQNEETDNVVKGPTQKKIKSNPAADNNTTTEVCSIEEDVSAHFLIKKILTLEASFTSTEAAVSTDKSLWELQQETSSTHFAVTLFNYLEQNNKLKQYLNSNRGCFSLVFLVDIKETQGRLKAWIRKHKVEVEQVLNSNLATNQGAKVLSQKIDDCLK